MTFYFLMDGIPFFDIDKQIAAKYETDHSPQIAGTVYFSMNIIVFNKTAYLAIQHPIKLCRK